MFCLKKIYLYLFLCALVTVGSCRKDVEEFRPYVPTQEDLDPLLKQVPDALSSSTFLFGGSIPDTTLTTSSGVRIFLADTEQLFADETGATVPCSTCPSLKIDVTTVLRKGDIIARGISTSRYPDARMLESAGVVEIRASCSGKALQLLPGRYVKVQIPATNVSPGMEVFAGKIDPDAGWKGWTATGTQAFWAEWPLNNPPGLQSGYELIVPTLGWSNCARPLVEQSSPFCVTLPDQFTALNARVFLVFDNIRAVTELKGDDATSTFCFPEAPLGYPVKVVVLGKTGGQHWLVSNFTEIGSNVQMSLTPQPLEEQQVITFLKNL